MSLASNLATLGALMKTNLETKGVSGLNSNMGLTTLANKILDINNNNESVYLFSDSEIIQSGDTINIYAAASVDGRELLKNQRVYIRYSNVNFNNHSAYSGDVPDIDVPLEAPCTFSWVHTRGVVKVLDDYSQTICTFNPGQVLIDNNISTPALCNLVWDGAGYFKFYVNGVDYTSSAQSAGLSSYHAQGGIMMTFVPVTHLQPMAISNLTSFYGEYPHGISGEKVGYTGNNGIISYSYTGFGCGKIYIRAQTIIEERTLLQETYEVTDCLVIDVGTNDIWNVIGTNANLTNNTTTRTFTGNQWSYTQLKVNGSVDIAKDNYCVEFDIVSTTNTSGNAYTSFNLRDSASHNIYLQSNKQYKIEIKDKIYYWIDGVAQTPLTHNITTTFQLQMVLREADMNIVFKNFKIYPI
ncbi:MAG: hypothetical protein K6A34_07125 [Methanobrevibacter sp.]|nr:hypothetical protein [Methanobrevibacter sp.]